MRKALAVCLIISGLGMAFYGFSAFASAAVVSDLTDRHLYGTQR